MDLAQRNGVHTVAPFRIAVEPSASEVAAAVAEEEAAEEEDADD